MRNDIETPFSLESWLNGDVRILSGRGLPWLESEQHSAIERVRQRHIPSTRQEAWRYTSLKSLTEQRFSPYLEPQAGIGPSDLQTLLIPDLDAYRAVLVNGRFVPALSDLASLPQGVRAASLQAILQDDPDAVAPHLNRLAGEDDQLFSALNTAGMDDGFVLLVDRDVAVERPIEILHLSSGGDQPRVAQPRHLIVMGEGARARIVERYASLGDPLYCTNSVLELVLERDAALGHYRLQMESRNAFHLTGLYLSQAQGSRYDGLNLGLGGAWSRTDLVARFSGPNAESVLNGLYLAGDGQLVDYHLDVDHRVPNCASRESYKGILYGKGRAVFDGRIHVARNAQKTDAHLSNKNLLLSRTAEVDTKPQLEIFADDVKCSHGTTVGQIDPEALFYLRSRGISEPMARRILCLGFAHEIIDGLEPVSLSAYAAAQVASALDKAPLE